MNIWQAIFLGLTQGLTEFLPVSSSGHLVLIQDIMGISGESVLFFDCMLHLATLVAVCAVLYKDIWGLVYPKPSPKLGYLALATVPAVIVGLLFEDKIQALFSGGMYLGAFFLVTATLLVVTEILSKRQKKQSPIKLKHGAIMGVVQAAAVLPGISRSGSTICAGVLSGADRGEAASFSFLMSIPIILGSVILPLLRGSTATATAEIGAGAVIAGMLAAALSGYLAIRLMLRIIKKSNYKYFAVYLTLLAIFTFIYYSI